MNKCNGTLKGEWEMRSQQRGCTKWTFGASFDGFNTPWIESMWM